jgi:hypothetical protein
MEFPPVELESLTLKNDWAVGHNSNGFEIGKLLKS